MLPPDHRQRPSAQWALTACSGSKRRRRLTACVSTVAPDPGTMGLPPWASMDEDLLRLIAWRVLAGDLLDYVRFRAVCPHWRSSTMCPRGSGVVDPRFHPRRWMMLPEGHGLYPAHGKLRGYIRFFNLDSGKFVRVKLPIFKDHCVLDSVDGILVMCRDKDTTIRLFHPFTGDVADLPPLATLARHVNPDLPGGSHPVHKFHYLGGVCASFSVSVTGVITAMLALHRMSCVAFATSSDRQWNLSTWTLDYRPPLSFQGKLYMVRMNFTSGQNTDIFQVDPPQEERVSSGSSLPSPKLIATIPADKLTHPIYLAECQSQILVVGYTDGSYSRMAVYRLSDLLLEKFVAVRSIGDKALFINERSIYVSANKGLPTVVGGTIVHPRQKNGSLTQYHISSDTWSRPMDGCIRTGPVFGPCCLIYYIYTCCRREYWNKGQLYNRSKACKWRVKGKWRRGA
uniref:KIB1-4 beta-propeller domain-containing protein n=1 Tax=Arundo donax TaxID=35708 RepID=A0A0A9CIH3_ARUDO